MKQAVIILSLVLLALSVASAEEGAKSLLDARKGYETKLVREESDTDPLTPPPARFFSLVQYETPIGKMGAYLGVAPEEGKKHPAIIWITGGFPAGGIGEGAWKRESSENDQSAKSYRQAGLVLMYPSLRGSFGNPGKQETFYGEVDDILAAAEYLAKVEYVDPERIYLGGHSTGGTLVLLVAAATDRFKAVFSFGPVEDPALYGSDSLTYDAENETENRLRSPIHFLGAIRSPTFVIEGKGGNIDSLENLQKASKNPKVTFLTVDGVDHFEVLGPSNEAIAAKIAKLDAKTDLALTAEELAKACAAAEASRRESADLKVLAAIRATGVSLDETVTVEHYILSDLKTLLKPAEGDAKAAGFKVREIKQYPGRDGFPYYVMFLTKELKLGDLPAVFATSAAAIRVAKEHDLQYDGWYVE